MSATLEIPNNLCELNLGVMWWVMREQTATNLSYCYLMIISKK